MTADGEIPLVAVIGAVIGLERRAQGIEQAQLANKLGLHPVSLSKIERGIQKDIGVTTLLVITQGLGLEFGVFVERCVRLQSAEVDAGLRGQALGAALGLAAARTPRRA